MDVIFYAPFIMYENIRYLLCSFQDAKMDGSKEDLTQKQSLQLTTGCSNLFQFLSEIDVDVGISGECKQS